jgi:integrase/recombinase XerD
MKPAQSIESSVPIPKTITTKNYSNNKTANNQILKTQSNPHITKSYEMRDLYHRKEKLAYWINRANTELQEPDKTDVLNFIQFMHDKERSILWVIRCITALLLMRRHLGKSFKDANKDDIRSLLKWMEDKNYRASTHEKFRRILKFYYKVVYGNNEHYPEVVKWFSVNLGKEKHGKETNMNIAEYLEEEEVKKLIEAAPTAQKKAFLACMYESGARPEEFLRLTNLDIKVDSKGAVFMLRGKTGERRVRIISFVKLLQQWLVELHPLKSQNQYPLWISTATNFKNQPLGLRGAQKIIEETLPKAGLTNKHRRLYILRHSRATHLANHLTEAQMCIFFGWQHGTKVVRRYIHLSGKDVDNALIALNEGGGQIKTEEYKLKSIICKRCSESISIGMNFCSKCALPVNLDHEYTREMELQNENKILKEKYEKDMKAMREEMNQQFSQIMSMIQQNPKLAQIKPNVLINKKFGK